MSSNTGTPGFGGSNELETPGFGAPAESGGVTSVSNSDGTLSISPTTGPVVASARTATSSLLGVVKPDNSTITIAGGVLSAPGGAPGTVTFTDGSNTVAAVTNLTVTGAVIGGASPNATLTIPPGTVTSVTLTLPSFLNVSPATITTAGTFAVTLATQAPNVVLSGPTSGGVATPTFRALVSSDIPAANLASTSQGGVTGNLPVSHLNSGTGATASTFWRGDATWATPAGAGNVSNVATPTNGQIGIWTGSTTLSGVSNLPVANLNSGTGASSSTFWRGDGTWATPAGGVVSSVSNSDGTLTISPTTGNVVASARTATSSVLGVVKPDNSTIVVSGGVLSAAGAVPGAINLAAAYGLVADGYKAIGSSDPPTDNGPAFFNMMGANAPPLGTGLIPSLKTINPTYGRAIPVSISGSVITALNPDDGVTPIPHLLRVSDAVVLFTPSGGGGALPSGVTSMVPVYVSFNSMTLTAFKITAYDINGIFCTSNIAGFGGAGQPPDITLGAGSSHVYMATVNADWLKFFIPAGAYYSSSVFRLQGPRKLDIDISGVTIVGAGSMAVGFFGAGYVGGFYPQKSFPINTTPAGSTSTILKNAADAANFTIGGMLLLGDSSLQEYFGRPSAGNPNVMTYEFKRIVGISGGAITFGPASLLGATEPTLYGYSDTTPNFSTNDDGQMGAGTAVAMPCGPEFDAEIIIRGGRTTGTFQWQISGRYVHIIGLTTDGEGPYSSCAQDVIFDNLISGPGRLSLITDKLVANQTVQNSRNIGSIQIEGAGPNKMTVRNSTPTQISGTARNMVIEQSEVELGLLVGPAFGFTETLDVRSSTFGNFQPAVRVADDPNTGGLSLMVNTWSFSGGVLKKPIINIGTAESSWMVKGAVGFVNNLTTGVVAGGDERFANMGAPYKIIDLTMGSSNSATVAVSGGGGSPTDAVVTWSGSNPTANGDVVSFLLYTPMPSGGQLITSTPYWVRDVSSLTHKLAAFLGGPALQTSGTGSSPTIFHKPTFDVTTTLESLPVGSQTTGTVTIAHGTPIKCTTTLAGGQLTPLPADGTYIAIQTTGTLPATAAAVGTAATCSISGTVLTVAGFSAGIIFPRLSPIGVGITAGTIITAYGTGVGGNGTYYVNKSQTVGPIAMTFNDPLGGIIDAFAAGNSGVPKMYVTLNRNVGAGTFELSVDGSTSINGASDASAAGSGVHTVTTRPIKVVPHPCPCVTVTGSGGHVNVVDARSAPTQGRPFRSYGARSFTGQMHAIASNLTSPMLVWGNLKKMTIDVIKADTTTGGGARTMILGETQATFTGTAGTPSTHITATVVTGYISPGDTVIGTGITAGTKVVSQVSGPPGGAGEYILSAANTTSAASVTAYGCNGFDANQLPLDFSGSIDLLNVGSRVITNLTGTTTSVMIGADSFAFYTGWLSDSVRPSFPDLVGGQPISSYAQLAITVETDQGIFTTPYPVYARTSAWPNIALEVDTIVPAVGTDIGV